MIHPEPRWLTLFREISAVPRCSGHREHIVAWILSWAKANGFPAEKDSFDNIRIDVPGSKGRETCSPVILQGHMDMVCEKVPGSPHDFQTDPLVLVADGEWLRAEGTSLGADNGIALALAFALAEDRELVHPPLEILVTSDEEIGLIGAGNLSSGFLSGTRLINIDSEEEGVFTVGCAGGRDTDLFLNLERDEADPNDLLYRVSLTGLTGGHSGIDIASHRGNANVLLGRLLYEQMERRALRLVSLEGGTAHNAIPRDSRAVICLPGAFSGEFQGIADYYTDLYRSEWPGEPDLSVIIQPVGKGDQGWPPVTCQDSIRAVRLIRALPHGVQAFSQTVPGFVETSTNLAILELQQEGLRILTNQRSSVPSRLEALSGRISAVAGLAGARVTTGNGYPPWSPQVDSPLREMASLVYREIHGRDPVVELTHAGLECGQIGQSHPGLDMISLGPDIRAPHSPGERLNLASAERVSAFLAALLARL